MVLGGPLLGSFGGFFVSAISRLADFRGPLLRFSGFFRIWGFVLAADFEFYGFAKLLKAAKRVILPCTIEYRL